MFGFLGTKRRYFNRLIKRKDRFVDIHLMVLLLRALFTISLVLLDNAIKIELSPRVVELHSTSIGQQILKVVGMLALH